MRDLASALEIATYRASGGGAPDLDPARRNEVYTVVNEHGAVVMAQGRIAGALQAATQHVERLDRDVAIWDAAHKADADRVERKARAQQKKGKRT